VKDRVLDAVQLLRRKERGFSLAGAPSGRLPRAGSGLTPSQLELLDGTIRNRDITREARALLKKKPLDHRRLGELLSVHQTVLRDVLCISTPKSTECSMPRPGRGRTEEKSTVRGAEDACLLCACEPEAVAEAVARAGENPASSRSVRGPGGSRARSGMNPNLVILAGGASSRMKKVAPVPAGMDAGLLNEAGESQNRCSASAPSGARSLIT